MNKRRVWFWIVGGFALLSSGVLGARLGLFPWQWGDLYKDPQGHFTMQIGSWEQVKADGPYAQFRLADPPMNMYLLVLEARTIDEAFSQALETVGFDPGLLTGGSIASLGDWQLYTQEDSAGLSYGLAGQIVGENAYVLMVKPDGPGFGPANVYTLGALTSIEITGKEEIVIESYSDLEALVRLWVDSRAGSVSVAVVHQGQIVYTYVYGEANPLEGIPADTQTIYQSGSMTKVFTASALMQLVEQELVDLDVWPGAYIPEFPERWHVTVRQLLNHSACMPDNQYEVEGLIAKRGESFASLEEVFTTYVKDTADLLCPPGKVSNYSNAHFLALGRIIEEVSGESFETYVVNHILTPLAMESTHFQLVKAEERYAKGQFPAANTNGLIARLNQYRGPGQEYLFLELGEPFATMDDFRIFPPWGGLLGTPSDITHFLQMHLNEGSYGDIQILQPESVATMQEMQFSTDGSPLNFGLSWWIGKDEFGEFFNHGGAGPAIESTMRFYPDLELGVVVMGSVNGYQVEKIAQGVVSAWMHER
jgi:CubicO group peptidase (beta-lactamase class C family)